MEPPVVRSDQDHRPRTAELTWDEFLHGYSLPYSSQRIDPLNQRDIRWTVADIPSRFGTDSFPKMRSNIIELISRNQQEPWWQHGIYTELVLTTLEITQIWTCTS